MKHFLYGTTALATAGLIAGVAGNAAAAERINVGVHGYHQQFLAAVDQDYQNSTVSGAEETTNLVDQKHNSEICFIGETTLDNGITFGINVQLEGNTEGDQIDESYLYIKGDNLGQFILGDENNAGYLLHVTAPDGGVSLDSGDLISIGAFVNPGLTLFDTAVGTTNLRFGDNDSGKITYITPRFAGIQFGVSFIPQFEGGGDNNDTRRLNQGNSNEVNNGWAGGINFTEDFNGFGVKLSVGGMYGDNGADSVTGDDDDLTAVNAGFQLSYGGFTIGGGASKGDGAIGATQADSQSWILGATYEVGPYAIGINYMDGEQDQDDGELQQAAISGTYQLGPGIRLVGAVFAFDGETDDQSNDGIGGIVGFKLGF